MTERELMEMWLAQKARCEDADSAAKAERAELETIESQIASAFAAAGKWDDGHAAKIPGLTVTCRQKFRATYQPDKWRDILAWAASSGHTAVVQRRMGDKAVLELFDAGVPLPDGLGLEGYKELSFTRS